MELVPKGLSRYKPGEDTKGAIHKDKKPYYYTIKIEGRAISVVNEVKYLGITLDSRLTWSHHCKMIAKHGITMMAQCRKAVGLKWGF